MKKITHADGKITFTLPDSASDMQSVSTQRKPQRRGAAANAKAAGPFEKEIEDLLTTLTVDDYQVFDRFSLDLGEGSKQRVRRGAKARQDTMGIDVTLEPDESAVLLIEQEGTYEWHFPEKVSLQRGPKRRGRQSAIQQKTAVFLIPVGEGEPPKQRRAGTRTHRGPITNFIKGKIKGFILKFAARKVVGALSKRMEKGVKPGPVIITSHKDTNGWQQKDNFLSMILPNDRPARILLLVHGTFSNTVSSFGALTVQPAGQRFLGLALDHYDAILGYDHYTLAETPAQNAEAMFEALLKLQKQSQGIEIDSISFSRGGLVYRYLTEQIIPFEKTQLAFRKSIFVGCTNAGTELANDENWKYLVDFYTNIVAGASRLLGMFPSAKLPAQIFSQAIQTIGSLVKYMAQDAVADNSVPGLSAMDPEGRFVTAINTIPATRTRPGASSYYAIGSSFEPDRKTYAGKLGKRLAFKVADGFVDQLMGEANDLVVNTDSMFIVDPVSSAQLLEKLPFGENGEIYHTVYFNQPQVARQCSQWLGLVQASSAASDNAPRGWWKEAVSNDFQIVPGESSVEDAMTELLDSDTRFVVIERPHRGELLHYGIPKPVLLESMRTHSNPQSDLIEMLDLHEYQSSGISLDTALDATNATELKSSAALENGRYTSVVLSEAGPVGVVAPPEVFSSDEMLEELAPFPTFPTLRQPVARRSVKKMASFIRSGHSSRTSMTRGEDGSSKMAAPIAETVWCNAHAVMPEEAVINIKAAVEVTLSRDEIIRQSGIFGGGIVQLDKDIIIQVLARKHCIVSGDSRIEVPVPATGDETQLFFDIIPKHEGIGEVNVIVRQGNRPIANLKLHPRFLAEASGEAVGNTVAQADLTPLDARRELPNILYIREGEMGLKQVLHFDFESRSLNTIVRCTSEPFKDKDSREDYIKNLYQELENFWANDQLEYDSFMRKLQARGVEIFDQLFPLELRRLLWNIRDNLNTIQVISDEPFIPWELAYLKEPGRKAKRNSYFLAEKGMVRWLTDAKHFPPVKLRLRDGKAYYVVPNYPAASGYQLQGAQAERKMLENILSAKPVTATSSKVQDSIEIPGNFDILHFACHGLASPDSIWDAGLMMKGKMANGKYQQDHLLSSQIEAFGDMQEEDKPGPLVFLNACQIGRQGYNLTGTGGFAGAFVNSGVGAFIGTHWSVGDTSAFDFSETLYNKLLDGKNMMTAVATARKASKTKQDMTWLAYVVYADPYARLIKE